MKCVVIILTNVILLTCQLLEFDKDEQPLKRNSTICSECRIKIITVFPKLEDE